MKDKFKETLSNILSYLLKVERRTLLWENPNMTGEMGATTITLSDDLSNYDAIEIDYNAYVNVHRTSQRCYNISQDITLSNGDSNSLYRTISKASERTLSIGIGYLGANASNQACIPRRIYGIKLGGVLRSPVISRLCAILKIGGGVDEGECRGIACEDTCKATTENCDFFCNDFIRCGSGFGNDKHATSGRSDYQKSVHFLLSERTVGLLRYSQRNGHIDSNSIQEQLFFGVYGDSRINSILRNLTLSERGCAV